MITIRTEFSDHENEFPITRFRDRAGDKEWPKISAVEPQPRNPEGIIVPYVGYSVVRTCVCDGAYNRIVMLYGYGRYVYMCCKIWMVMRPLRKIYNERYEIVRLNLCSRLLHV